MAGKFSDDEIISGINVTPLVDVVLVLLVIFMVTAPAIYQSMIKVSLPQASNVPASSESQSLQLTLTKTGSVFWGKTELSWPDLEKQAREYGKTAGEKLKDTVMINADEAAPHGTVVKLMNLLRTEGLTRFAFTVNSQSTQ